VGKTVILQILKKLKEKVTKMAVLKVANDAEFSEKLHQSGTKLVVIDFSADW
jgi:hypothetical protein